MATATRPEATASLRWCQASAIKVEESMRRPSQIEKEAMSSLRTAETSITTTTKTVPPTGVGWSSV